MKDILLCGCQGENGPCGPRLRRPEGGLPHRGGCGRKRRRSGGFSGLSKRQGLSGKGGRHHRLLPSQLVGRALEYAFDKNVPIVLATTGYHPDQIQKIEEAAKKIPIFFSFNMSLGINLLAELAKKAAAFLGDQFDIEIVEKHHNRKIDAPSGTALLLADAINEAMDNKEVYIYDRHSSPEKTGEKRDRHLFYRAAPSWRTRSHLCRARRDPDSFPHCHVPGDLRRRFHQRGDFYEQPAEARSVPDVGLAVKGLFYFATA